MKGILKIRKVTHCYNMKVFTDEGYYFGDVDEAILTTNKVSSWKIKATKNSLLTSVLDNARGVIIPHNLVKAVGDVMVIAKAAIPTHVPSMEMEE